jgi:hypothetical protein
MAVLVVLLGVVVALLGLLVAGVLRSHAEILRALHGLGVDLDPARPDGVGTAVAAPVVRADRAPTVRSGDVPSRPSRDAVDVVGSTPDGGAMSVAVGGRDQLTLLAFLSTGCSSCHFFWDAFGAPDLEVPGEARLVIVTKGPNAEQPGMVRKLAPATVPVVMSSDAWDGYDVPVAPFFVLVDGASRAVVGEGAANTWEHVEALMRNALDDAGLLDAKGRRRRGASPKARADVMREDRVDRDLLAAGIGPNDPRLSTLPADPPRARTEPE